MDRRITNFLALFAALCCMVSGTSGTEWFFIETEFPGVQGALQAKGPGMDLRLTPHWTASRTHLWREAVHPAAIVNQDDLAIDMTYETGKPMWHGNSVVVSHRQRILGWPLGTAKYGGQEWWFEGDHIVNGKGLALELATDNRNIIASPRSNNLRQKWRRNYQSNTG